MVKASIYNEKGGVGKTTLTILLSSYLGYILGRRVCVLDFDSPTYHLTELRRTEEALLVDPRSQLSAWLRENPNGYEPYEIRPVPISDRGSYDITSMMDFVVDTMSEDFDVLIYDFPGRWSDDEPVSFLAANGCLDFVGIPMDTDSQSRRSALVMADALHNEGIPCAAFWNRVSPRERTGSGERFQRGAEPFLRRGVPVMAEMVRDIRKFSRDCDEKQFVRSTMCFPERYIKHWSPSLIPFLESLTALIDANAKHCQP